MHCIAGADFVWQWQGDQDGEWFPYPAGTCLALQAAKNGHGETAVEATVGRTRYKLDTTRMVQTNTRTGFERLMQRRESGTRGQGVPLTRPLGASSGALSLLQATSGRLSLLLLSCLFGQQGG